MAPLDGDPSGAAAFCPGCGRPRRAGDAFCGGCGRRFADVGSALVPTSGATEAAVRVAAGRRWPSVALGVAVLVGLLAGLAIGSITVSTPEPRSVASPIVGLPTATATAAAAASPATAAASTPLPTSSAASPTAVTGQVVPAGQAPPPSPTPAAVFYRGAPFGPSKIEARAVQPVRLSLPPGTRVVATLTVAFNNRLSNVSGTPDVDVTVSGPTGVLASYPMAHNGRQIAFQALSAGDYTILLSNERSRVNAKQVGLQFLQP